LPRPKHLDEKQVRSAISAAPERPGRLLPSNHIREQMRKKNFDMSDAIKVLDEAEEIKPVWNTKSTCWNYDIGAATMTGTSLR